MEKQEKTNKQKTLFYCCCEPITHLISKRWVSRINKCEHDQFSIAHISDHWCCLMSDWLTNKHITKKRFVAVTHFSWGWQYCIRLVKGHHVSPMKKWAGSSLQLACCHIGFHIPCQLGVTSFLLVDTFTNKQTSFSYLGLVYFCAV